MNKTIFDVLEIQNELLEDLISSRNPDHNEKLEEAKSLVHVLKNGYRRDRETFYKEKENFHNPNRNF